MRFLAPVVLEAMVAGFVLQIGLNEERPLLPVLAVAGGIHLAKEKFLLSTHFPTGDPSIFVPQQCIARNASCKSKMVSLLAEHPQDRRAWGPQTPYTAFGNPYRGAPRICQTTGKPAVAAAIHIPEVFDLDDPRVLCVEPCL